MIHWPESLEHAPKRVSYMCVDPPYAHESDKGAKISLLYVRVLSVCEFLNVHGFPESVKRNLLNELVQVFEACP